MPLRPLGQESRQAAEAYFEEWVLQGGRRLEAFARRTAEAGGPAGAMTFEPESLSEVFAWAAAHVRLVTGEVVDDGDLPPWQVPGSITHPMGEYDPESARWVDGLCRYYGEVLVRHVPGASWKIGDEPRRRRQYIDQNWPVVAGPTLAVNPLYAGGLAAKQGRLPPEQRRVDLLLDNFRHYRDIALAGGGSTPEGGDWWVDDVDVEAARAQGWRLEVGAEEELEPTDAAADDLTRRLLLLPGVTGVERADRTSWLVAGDVRRGPVEATVRVWAAER